MMSHNDGFINSTIVCNDKKVIDLDALNLLASSKIVVFCQCSYKNEKRHHHFIYNTNNLIPLTQLQKGMSFENVIDILSASVDMIKVLAEFNLFLDNVKNATEYIFKADIGYRFVYIPIVKKPHLSIKDYLLKLISVLRYKDVRLSQFIKKLRKKKDNEQVFNYLTAFVSSYNSQHYCPNEDTLLLYDEGATTLLDNKEKTLIHNVGVSSTENEKILVFDDGDTTVLSQVNNSEEYNFLNTYSASEVLTECYHDELSEHETTVLTSQTELQGQVNNKERYNEYYLYFISNLNGEKITINMTPFTIGKDSANMDLVLKNDSVSRHHATVIYENNNYYIMDNNSTNGTMIEGIRIQAGEKGKIENGYIISLGNESFQAYIERR